MLPEDASREDQLAVLSWSRAVQLDQFEHRVQALWDCLEFYGRKVKIPDLFDEATVQRLKDAVGTIVLSEAEAKRVAGMVSGLNSPPLMARLEYAVDADGAPVSPDDWKVLRRLRDVRNGASHGRQSDGRGRDDLAHGLSIVARMLAYRAWRLARRTFPPSVP